MTIHHSSTATLDEIITQFKNFIILFFYSFDHILSFDSFIFQIYHMIDNNMLNRLQ